MASFFFLLALPPLEPPFFALALVGEEGRRGANTGRGSADRAEREEREEEEEGTDVLATLPVGALRGARVRRGDFLNGGLAGEAAAAAAAAAVLVAVVAGAAKEKREEIEEILANERRDELVCRANLLNSPAPAPAPAPALGRPRLAGGLPRFAFAAFADFAAFAARGKRT